jgi:mannosyltransferase
MGIQGRKRVEASYRVEDEATRLITFFRSLQ